MKWILTAVILGVAVPTVSAQDRTNDKAPYNMIYFDVGGDIFRAKNSSASKPTQICRNNLIPNTVNTCAAQFSTVGSGSFAMGVRPFRYAQIDVAATILGNFNQFSDRIETFQCVSGCGSTAPTINQSVRGVSGLITTGARGVLPLFREHLLISAGAGYAWLRTNERPDSRGSDVLRCSTCRSIGGSGPTQVAELMYLPNPHVGLGFHVRNVKINSNGLTPISNASHYFGGATYKDRFLLIGGEISIRWLTRQ